MRLEKCRCRVRHPPFGIFQEPKVVGRIVLFEFKEAPNLAEKIIMSRLSLSMDSGGLWNMPLPQGRGIIFPEMVRCEVSVYLPESSINYTNQEVRIRTNDTQVNHLPDGIISRKRSVQCSRPGDVSQY